MPRLEARCPGLLGNAGPLEPEAGAEACAGPSRVAIAVGNVLGGGTARSDENQRQMSSSTYKDGSELPANLNAIVSTPEPWPRMRGQRTQSLSSRYHCP